MKLYTIKLLGIPVTSSSEDNILEFLSKCLAKKGKKLMIVTPNPEMVMHAYHNKVYQGVLRSADISLPDGIGLLWGAKVLGKKLQSRITGVDFMQKLCKDASECGFTVGFVGGMDRVAEKTAERLKNSYKNLDVKYVGGDPEVFLKEKISVDILFVALGAPKQEMWMHENWKDINAKAVMGVGGAFDYVSGKVVRAPKWMRKVGLEWLYRLVRQPWRWSRQLSLLEFVYVVFKTRFAS